MNVVATMDTDAFDALYPKLFEDLRRVCRGLGLGPDADDVAQQVLTDARSQLQQLRDDHRLLPWLRRIAVRKAAKARRSSARHASLLSTEPGVRPQIDLAIDEANALDSLPTRQRQVVFLVYFAGYRQDEVAEMLGVQRGTVARTLWDARKHLAAVLAEYREATS